MSQVELLAIEVGGREFGLDLAVVKEVIRPSQLLKPPELPDFIAGVINFRGVAIPVVDLGTRLETGNSVAIGPKPAMAISPRRLVICAVGQAVVAFAVDGAAEIIRDGGRSLVCVDANDLLSVEERLSIESFRMRKEDLG